MGLLYGGGAMLFLALAVWLAPEGLLLGWPAISLAIVAGGYLGLGPGVFRKKNGQLDLTVRLLLGPYLLGLYIRRLTEWPRGYTDDQIMPGLRLGRTVNHAEAVILIESGVTSVLDLTCEHNEAEPLRRLDYQNIQMLDLVLPDPLLIHQAVTFVVDRMQRGVVYLHCALGHGRSAIVAAACLLARDRNLGIDSACDVVRTARPGAKLRPRERTLLAQYLVSLGSE
jgi:protein-tyrosine phosphatase